MELRSTVGTVLTLGLVGIVVVMLIGQQLGQPIVFGFVLTGSMSPTLEPGDGFVAVPPAVAGDIEEGDVVTFDAQELQGGGLTTHRIVGQTEEGYITRGDANPFTDQDGPEPPVQESQIVAVAWQYEGEVVVIPNLGSISLAIQGAVGTFSGFLSGIPGLGGLAEGGFGTVMVGGGLLLLIYSFLSGALSSGREREQASRSRSRKGVFKASVVLLVILLLIVGPATASMILPSGSIDQTIVSSQSPSEDPTVIEIGGSQDIDYNITNEGYVPRLVILEPTSAGVEVSDSNLYMSHGETAKSTVTLYAPDETGAYVRTVSERHYLVLLPISLIEGLHGIHPLVAVLVIDLVIIVVVTVIFVVAVGLEPFRFRSRDRNLSVSDRIQRKIRKWL